MELKRPHTIRATGKTVARAAGSTRGRCTLAVSPEQGAHLPSTTLGSKRVRTTPCHARHGQPRQPLRCPHAEPLKWPTDKALSVPVPPASREAWEAREGQGGGEGGRRADGVAVPTRGSGSGSGSGSSGSAPAGNARPAHATSPRDQPTRPAHATSPGDQLTRPAHATSPRVKTTWPARATSPRDQPARPARVASSRDELGRGELAECLHPPFARE
jgi:hypothetical protein